MILLLFQLIGVRAARVSAWWQGVRLPCKIAPVTGLPTLGGMGYGGLMVAERIKENVVQRVVGGLSLVAEVDFSDMELPGA
jgi:hypothetical protein